jgi:branched-chain amino acid transport system substrate-binding protein
MKHTLVALAVLGLGASAVQAQEVVKLGAAALTGTQSHLGKDIENGVRLALEDYNAKGVTLGGKKVKFEVMAEDDAADPKTATTVAQRFVDAASRAWSATSTPAPRSPPRASTTKAASRRFRRPPPTPS